MFRFFLPFFLLVHGLSLEAQQELYPVRDQGNWGMMNAKGELIVAANYTSIGAFEEGGYAIAQKGELLGVLDSLGTLTVPCEYKMLDQVGRGLFSVKAGGRWKIINSSNVVIIDSIAGKIDFLEDGYLSYEEISGKGLAHIERGLILAPKFSGFKFLNNQFIVAFDEDYSESLYDSSGQQILPEGFDKISLSNNWLWGRRSGKWGAYDLTGKVILPNDWADFKSVGPNFYHLIDENERDFLYSVPLDSIILSKKKEYYYFSNEYVQFENFQNKKGIIDFNGNILLKDEYEMINDFGSNAFRVKKDDKVGLVDKAGNEVAPIIYKLIGNPSRDVAIVRRNKHYGIINLNGEIVLPLVYTKNLSVDGNVARHKEDTTDALKMFFFDENGQLKRNSNFSNLKSLKIRNSGRSLTPVQIGATNGGQNPNQISDSLVWQFHPGARKWGLWNLDKKEYKFVPQWDNISVLTELGLTIVGKVRSDIGGRLRTGRMDLKVNQVFGLFNNKHGLPISKMEFLDIRTADFLEDSLDIARVVFVGGSHGLLSNKGRVVARGFVYIGAFVEGKARATRKGQLLVDLEQREKRPLMPARTYFGAFRSGFAFDTDDDSRLYMKFNQEGKLYCKEAVWGYINNEGSLHMKFKYDFVENFSNGRAMFRHNGRWGLLDEEGNEVLAANYDDLHFLAKSENKLYEIAQSRNFHGAVDSSAKIIVPVVYSKIRSFQEDRIAVRNSYRRWGFVDRNAKEIIPCQYRVVKDFSEGLAIVHEKSKWGAINKNGDMVIEPQYSRMGSFKEGKAWVMLKHGEKGYVDKSGALLFKGKFSRLTNFKNGIARVYIRKKGWGLIDTEGNFIMKPKRRFSKIEPFNEMGLAKVKIGKKYRLLNQEGHFVGKKAYGLIRDFKEGHAVVRVQALSGFRIGKLNLNFGFIDSTGELVTKEDFRQLQDFCEGRAVFTGDKSKRGYINLKGEVVVEPKYFKAEDFKDNRAVVWDAHNKSGVIDSTGTEIIPVKFNKIIDIKEGLALVRKNSWTYYFVQEDTKRHTPANYNEAYAFSKGMAPIKLNSKWGLINEKGIRTMIPKYARMHPYKNGIAKVEVHHLLGVADITGKIVIDPLYEYVSYVGNGLFRVELGDKMGYLDMDGNWVWEMR